LDLKALGINIKLVSWHQECCLAYMTAQYHQQYKLHHAPKTTGVVDRVVGAAASSNTPMPGKPTQYIQQSPKANMQGQLLLLDKRPGVIEQVCQQCCFEGTKHMCLTIIPCNKMIGQRV
jgi:hypothetical protein